MLKFEVRLIHRVRLCLKFGKGAKSTGHRREGKDGEKRKKRRNEDERDQKEHWGRGREEGVKAH